MLVIVSMMVIKKKIGYTSHYGYSPILRDNILVEDEYNFKEAFL